MTLKAGAKVGYDKYSLGVGYVFEQKFKVQPATRPKMTTTCLNDLCHLLRTSHAPSNLKVSPDRPSSSPVDYGATTLCHITTSPGSLRPSGNQTDPW